MKKALCFLDQYAEQIVLYIFWAILSAAVTLQVLTRVLGNAFSWTEEVARYSYVWFVLVGISYATKLRTHVRLELILSKFSGKAKARYEIFLDIITLVLCGYLLYLCVDYIGFSYMKKTPALQVSMSILNFSGIAGMGLNCIRTVQNIVLRARDLKKPEITKPVLGKED